MIVSNISGHTLWAEDIDEHYPYVENSTINLSEDTLSKSRCLRNLIISGMLNVVSYDENIQIEKAIMFAVNNNPKISTDTPEPDSTSNGIEVNIRGIFYEAGGYAKVNRYLAKNLSQLGLKVKVTPKNGQNQLSSDELKDIIALEKTPVGRNCIVIDSVIPSISEIPSGKYKILYTTVESYSLTKNFIDCCHNYNEIWITSPFGESILRKYIPDKPIFVIPTGVDPEIYNENVKPVVFNPPLKDFVFISTFGWSYRKGYDVLFKAYCEAFEEKDDVSLLVFSRYMQGIKPAYSQKIQKDIDAVLPRKNNLPHYKIVSKIVPESLMPQIYAACDSFVLPSRGEGSCIPPVEAAMCGLPVIMTNASGQTMYLKHDNSYLLEVDNIAPVHPGTLHVHYWDDQLFPSLKSEKCIKDLAGLMRTVYENYEEAKKRNKKLQKLLIENFTWEKAAFLAEKRISEIVEKSCERSRFD